MIFKPHNYQKYAIDFIENNPVAAAILDMGLGKTVITLTAIERMLHDSFEVSKVLIVAPLRVARTTWPEEIKKWDHLKNLSYSVVIGTPEERLNALSADADIYIINRENLAWLMNQPNYFLNFDMAVLDELSSFKANSMRTKAFLKLRPRLKRVVGLTGTPSSNGLMDLFFEFKCLDMGKRLGRFITRYRTAYFKPDRYNGNVVYSYKLLPGAEQAIYDRISDITISMKAVDHLNMPELISTEYSVDMDEKERSNYEALKKDLILDLPEHNVTAANAASLSNKLSQMANGAVYADDEAVIRIHDRKLEALEDIIESANGRPVLVAYWYKHDLERITKLLDKLKVEYARISSPGSIQAWNEGRFSVGLIHPASAGHGLNLQAGGNHLVWFGLTWSLELYQQTNARLYRQGQKEGTVVITHIVTKNTIDERVLKALENKDLTQNSLIEAVKAEL
ncbi:MAG: DEAD/DEAH box helicase [Clostridia bacterium]|nr:DEAD/DEAH box helicase [Clostridia bacterium]